MYGWIDGFCYSPLPTNFNHELCLGLGKAAGKGQNCGYHHQDGRIVSVGRVVIVNVNVKEVNVKVNVKANVKANVKVNVKVNVNVTHSKTIHSPSL